MVAGDEQGGEVEVQRRRGTIGNIVETMSDGSLRVVVQGFLHFRFMPFGCDVALDGFHKRANGDIEPLADEEYYEFD